MKKEQADAPLILSMNAFRGFLDEFRKTEATRQKDFKKDERRMKEKPPKREKHKKTHDIIVRNNIFLVKSFIKIICLICQILLMSDFVFKFSKICIYTSK